MITEPKPKENLLDGDFSCETTEEKEYGCKLITISVINDSYEKAALAGIEYVLNNLIQYYERIDRRDNEPL